MLPELSLSPPTIVFVKKILIIHHSQEDTERVRASLEKAGFQVVTAEGSEDGMKELYQECPDTVIVADNSAEGQKLCSHIRGISDIPIVVIGNGDHIARATMLELGADACLGQREIAEELIARVNSLLRRYKRSKSANPGLDPETNRVKLGGQTFTLTPTEFRLFSCLAFNEGRVVPYSELIDDVWGGRASPDNVHFYFRRLKQRFGIDSVGPYRLLEYRSEGCCFCEDKAAIARRKNALLSRRRRVNQKQRCTLSVSRKAEPGSVRTAKQSLSQKEKF